MKLKGESILSIITDMSFLYTMERKRALINFYNRSKQESKPKNGGIDVNSSLFPYKNPMPVGPHI